MKKTSYKLFKGFRFIAESFDLKKLKNESPKEDGVYNIISSDKQYRDSWIIIGGKLYNN